MRRFAPLLLLLIPAIASAHPEGFSGLRVMVWPDHAQAILTVHTRDMSRWFPPGKFKDYVKDVCRKMEKSPGDLLEIHFDDTIAVAKSVRAFSPDAGMIEVDLEYPIDRPVSGLIVWSKHLGWLPSGHQQLLFIDDMSSGIADALRQDTLTSDQPSTTVELSAQFSHGAAKPQAPAAPSKNISFFLLGIQHILTGYDHLLFLAALLLVCKSFREAAGVITFFTVAHSITLTLAALDIVRMPARIVEPAIAASIVYVGLENIFGRHRFVWRALITFSFGLVHGLGFASALREFGLGSTSVGLVMPLLKFAIGLETGQLFIAAVLLQLMLTFRKRPVFERRWVPACSLLVALLGGYWMVTRVLDG